MMRRILRWSITMRLFLASESPRRRELLRRVLAEFEVEGASVQELDGSVQLPAKVLTARNAALKADAVARKHPEDWVLGADTVVVLDECIYGKPGNQAEAEMFLRKFSGRVHEVLTAVALRNLASGICWDAVAVSRVYFKVLSDEVIREYLRLVPVLDKAGAYGIQDHGEMLVERIEGELENIIGLPVETVRTAFKKFGIVQQ